MDGPRVWVLGGTEGNVVKLSAVNQVQGLEDGGREGGLREEARGGDRGELRGK